MLALFLPLAKAANRLLAAGLLALLTACGLAVPDISEPWDHDIQPGTLDGSQTRKISANALVEFEIQRRIYCDLKEAVQATDSIPHKAANSPNIETSGVFPPHWGAQVSISLMVEENSSLNPGASLISPLASIVTNPGGAHPVINPQSSSVGFGASLSSTATRVDKFDPYWSIDELLHNKGSRCDKIPGTNEFVGPYPPSVRATSSPFLIESADLGIQDWLVGSMMNWYLLHSRNAPPKFGDTKPGPDIITLELKFVIISSASITPAWKLARVSANSSSTFFGVGRTRTHDLIITIGPAGSQVALNTHLASQIRSGGLRP